MNDSSWNNTDDYLPLRNMEHTWGWFVTVGIVVLILGLIAMYASVATTLLTLLTLGFIAGIGGIAQVIHSFFVRQWSGFFGSLLTGILLLVISWFLLSKPLLSAASVTMLMAIFFMASGLTRSLYSLFHRYENWGWFFVSGLISLALGLIIWSQWPISSLYIIGLFLGIDLIFLGASWMALGFSVRRLQTHLRT